MTSLLADFDGGIRALAIVLLVSIITTAFAFRSVFWSRKTMNRAGGRWDQIQGRIEHTDVYIENRGKIDVNVAQLTYSYKVKGEYFSGEFTRDFFRERKAYDFIDSIVPGTEVVVRCHPRDPSLSVLREEDNQTVFARRVEHSPS